MGFFSLELGPLGLLEALIVLGIALARVRRFPERTGAYLIGASLIPIALIGALMARMPSCDVGRSAHGECYAPITGPALVFYVLLGLVGVAITAFALRRMAGAAGNRRGASGPAS